MCGVCRAFLCEDCIKIDGPHPSGEDPETTCEENEIVDIEEDDFDKPQIEEVNRYTCSNQCGRENMVYQEAFEHYESCKFDTSKSRIVTLLEHLDNGDAVVDWDISSRCVKCHCIPFAPIFACICKTGLYCSFCRAHDESCPKCNGTIRASGFLENKFDEMVFKHMYKKFRCRFCHEAYTWEGLAIHERICYQNAGKISKDDIKNENERSYYITSEEYLKNMEQIFVKVQEKIKERNTKYKNEIIEANKAEQQWMEQSKKPFSEYIDSMTTPEKQAEAVQKHMDLIKSFPDNMEPPQQDQNTFVHFKAYGKKFDVFTFNKAKIEMQSKSIEKGHSRDILKSEGFKVIQTPISNRIFLIGGSADPWGTYEFNVKEKRFYPKGKLKGGDDLIISLGIGRVHHSLAATSGLIFCTGGHPDYLRDEQDSITDDNNGKVVEVLKLKDNMWVNYTNKLMNARY